MALLVQPHATEAGLRFGEIAPVFRRTATSLRSRLNRVGAKSFPDMDQFRKDLAAAGIPYVDAQGRRADFHALRHTLATNLTCCGVLPCVAMEFMRHSEMRLTNKTYTDVAPLSLAEAADMLPKFATKKGTQKGTHELCRHRFCS